MSKAAPMIRRRIEQLITTFELRTTGKWFLLSTLIGIVVGLGAIFFQTLTALVVEYSLAHFANYLPGEAVGEPVIVEVGTSGLQ